MKLPNFDDNYSGEKKVEDTEVIAYVEELKELHETISNLKIQLLDAIHYLSFMQGFIHGSNDGTVNWEFVNTWVESAKDAVREE